MDDARLDQLIDGARSERPGATIYLLPREDGQYSNHSTDVVALLEEAGVAVDYATDPMASGVYSLRSADIVLPDLVVLFANGAAYAGAIAAIINLIRWVRQRYPQSKVSLDVVATRDADGSSRKTIRIKRATVDEAERLLRAAAKVRPPR